MRTSVDDQVQAIMANALKGAAIERAATLALDRMILTNPAFYAMHIALASFMGLARTSKQVTIIPINKPPTPAP
jgi:hypothetical protein